MGFFGPRLRVSAGFTTHRSRYATSLLSQVKRAADSGRRGSQIGIKNAAAAAAESRRGIQNKGADARRPRKHRRLVENF